MYPFQVAADVSLRWRCAVLFSFMNTSCFFESVGSQRIVRSRYEKTIHVRSQVNELQERPSTAVSFLATMFSRALKTYPRVDLFPDLLLELKIKFPALHAVTNRC